MYHKQVVAVLQWLAFVDTPLRFDEVIEICVTDVDSEPYVQTDDREAWEAVTDVLFALVQTVFLCDSDSDVAVCSSDEEISDEDEAAHDIERVGDSHIVLAHFSVKEYLTSPRIWTSLASRFALDPNSAAHSRAQQCIAYILHADNIPYEACLRRFKMNLETHFVWPSRQSDLLKCSSFYKRAVANWARWQRQSEVAFRETPISGLELVLIRSMGQHPMSQRENIIFSVADWQPMMPLDGEKRGIPQCPLCIACAVRLPCTVDRLCRDYPETINVDHQDYGTALSMTSYRGYEDIVDILLAAGANPKLRTLYYSPIQSACFSGNVAIVKALLKAGAWVNGGCLLSSGVNLDLVSHEMTRSVDLRAPLSIAAGRGHTKVIKELLRAGAYVDEQTHGHPPALHTAARIFDYDVVELLIQAGADVNLRQLGSDRTAFQTALDPRISSWHVVRMIKTLELLLDAGANAKTFQSIHVFHQELAVLLRRYGVDRVIVHQAHERFYSA